MACWSPRPSKYTGNARSALSVRNSRVPYTTSDPAQFWANLDAIRRLGSWPKECQNEGCKSIPASHTDSFYALRASWVRYYCTRYFTMTSDRLFALLGVVKVVESHTGLRYINGHWDEGS